MPSEAADMDAPGQPHTAENTVHAGDASAKSKEQVNESADPEKMTSPSATDDKARKAKTPRGPEPFDQADREQMERLLHELRGHLGMPAFLDFE